MTDDKKDLYVFPRWQIRRIDGGLVMGQFEWLDAGNGAEPDWACAEDDDASLRRFYVAVQVEAIAYRSFPEY